MRLSAPMPGFLRTLAHPSLVPLPPAADDDLEAFAATPVGNGAFAMAGAREPEAFIRLARFDDHPRPAELDEVVLQIYADDPARERQWEDLLDGQLQVADVPPERLDEARERYGSSRDGYRGPGVLDGMTSTVYLYGFDTTQPPFDDPRVRRAISLSIDREALADEVMQGTRVAATSLVPPSIPGPRRTPATTAATTPRRRGPSSRRPRSSSPSCGSPTTGADPHRDRRGHGHRPRGGARRQVELQGRDLQPFVLGVRRGEYPLFRLGWESDDPDPSAYLTPCSTATRSGGTT
jgi:hypothetical protein